jgi:catechol 2,3-dioxygenase-like lactoylglutathione lyase family enzyme
VTPFALQRLDHVVRRVQALAAMVAFYVSVLGCSIERRRDDLGLVHLRAGASMIDLIGVDGRLGRAARPRSIWAPRATGLRCTSPIPRAT